MTNEGNTSDLNQLTNIYHLHILASILPLSIVVKTLYGNDSKITEFEMIDTNSSSTAYMVMYKLIA